MPRLKNLINAKDRNAQCVMTEGSITYKIPLGAEADKLGHYIESEVVNGNLVLRFAIKQATPAFRIEERPEFQVSFS
jgi:hypothetical protein